MLIAVWAASACGAPALGAGTLEPAPASLPEGYTPPTRSQVDAILEAAGEDARKESTRTLRIVLCAAEKDAGHLDPGSHDYPLWRERWSRLLAQGKGVRVETADSWPTRAQWRRADVIVLYSDNPAWSHEKAGSRRIAALGRDIDRFLARGGGLVFLHYALNAGSNGGALAARLGLSWTSPPAGYRYGVNEWTLEASHPLGAGIGTFSVPDEMYWNLTGNLEASGANVLMRSPKEGVPRPQMWTREVGKGRVFVSIPGHFTYTYDDPIYRLLVFRGMMWSAHEPIDRLASLLQLGARFAAAVASPAAAAVDPLGKAVFQDHCAVCHERGAAGAPPPVTLGLLGGAAIHEALVNGRMRAQGAPLSDAERREVSEFLSGRALDARVVAPKACDAAGDWLEIARGSVGTGWGIDEENSRSIPAAQAGLRTADLRHLRLKWSFAFPGTSRAIAQPLVAGGALFVGSADGTVYALDARTGCVHWAYKSSAEIVGGIVIRMEQGSRPVLFFADRVANTYAIDAKAGTVLWKVRMDSHPSATIMGTPVLADDRLLVPVISLEELAGGPEYPCCTFRGSLVAVRATTGQPIWKRYTIPQPAVEQFRNELGVPQYAPSGSGLWSAPTLDRKRGSVYFTTGNSYSEPTDDNSDAVFAVDFKTGTVKWKTQTLAGDAWIMWAHLCRHDPAYRSRSGCPGLKKPGPDIDFTTSPVLVRRGNGGDILVAGRKDGTVFGLDPDTGRIRWSTRTSGNPDPNAGALNFGLMAQAGRVFLPSVGTNFPNAASFIPSEDDGLFALDASTGKRLWASKTAEDCDRSTPCTGLSFAPIGIPGAVFAGATDGYVRAYDTATGRVLWRYDTAREFTTLNGEVAKGGAIGRNSIMIADGRVYVGSGYAGRPGNVLLAFSVDAT